MSNAIIKKPILAETAEVLSDIPLPCIASYKLDGIRCVKINGQALSRSLKPIPNVFIREWIEANLPDGIDGEIMLKDMTINFNQVQSAIMSEDGTPDFTFNAFDLVTDDLKEPFVTRYDTLIAYAQQLASEEAKSRLMVVDQVVLNTLEAVVAFEEQAFQDQAEGIMTRRLESPYKCGRSTLKEAALLKYKRWVDEEGTVIGFIEQMTNTNEKETNELGNSKRSKKKDGLVPAGTLGAIKVRRANGQEFDLGTGEGLTHAVRQEIWDNQGKYLNTQVKFKHQVSPNDPPEQKPRFPGWICFRSPIDTST